MAQMDKLKNSSVPTYLRRALAGSGKTFEEVAAALGYETDVAIRMLTAGATKLQLGQIKPLSTALGVDPAYLLRLVLSSYYPGLEELIEELRGTTLISQNERRLLAALRSHTENDAQAVVCDAREVVAIVMV